MGKLKILGLKCTHQDRTYLLTSKFRQQFGSNIGQNLGLNVSIMIEHRAHFRAKSFRIVIEHIKAYANLLYFSMPQPDRTSPLRQVRVFNPFLFLFFIFSLYVCLLTLAGISKEFPSRG
jgi:hypothetical protein